MAVHTLNGHLFILRPQNTSTQDPRASCCLLACAAPNVLTPPSGSHPSPPGQPSFHTSAPMDGSLRYMRAAHWPCARVAPVPGLCFLNPHPGCASREPGRATELLCSLSSLLPRALPSTARHRLHPQKSLRRLRGREAGRCFQGQQGR